MATRYDHQITLGLVRLHGWAWADPPPEGVIGDRWVVGPVTGKSHPPHAAKAVQDERVELKEST